MLQHCSNALQAHASVYRGRWQRVQNPIAVAIKLHEHKIPNLNIAVQIVIWAARWAAGNIGAVIVENFGAGSTGAGVPHLPEVVLIKA